jgi:hypothetical protein
MTRLAWEPFAAVAGGLALTAVSAWWLLGELAPPRAPIPGHQGEAFVALSAQMPQIRGFEDFNVNPDNPFVPWRQREVEKRALTRPTTVVVKPRPPAKIEVTQPPKLELPKARSGGGDAPRVIGFQRADDRPVAVLVNLPGETRPRSMLPGEKAGRWTFAGIEDGGIALFRDETGREYRLVVGNP